MAANKARGVQEIGNWIAASAASAAARGGAAARCHAGAAGSDASAAARSTTSCASPAMAATAAARRSPAREPARRWRRRSRDRRACRATATTSSRRCSHGLTGPVDGKTYTQVMVPMGAQQGRVDCGDRRPTSATASATRRRSSRPADVARVRALSGSRKTQLDVEEIEASLPVMLQTQPTWKATASHVADKAANGLTFVGWNSGGPSAAGHVVPD